MIKGRDGDLYLDTCSLQLRVIVGGSNVTCVVFMSVPSFSVLKPGTYASSCVPHVLTVFPTKGPKPNHTHMQGRHPPC